MCNYDPLHYFISLFIISENYWEKFFNNNPSIYLSLNDISRSDSASSPSLNPSLDIFMIEGHDYFRLPSMVRANARTLGATVIYPSPFIRRRRNPRVPERNLVVTSLNIPQCHERGCLHDCQKEYKNVIRDRWSTNKSRNRRCPLSLLTYHESTNLFDHCAQDLIR